MIISLKKIEDTHTFGTYSHSYKDIVVEELLGNHCMVSSIL